MTWFKSIAIQVEHVEPRSKNRAEFNSFETTIKLSKKCSLDKRP